MSEQPAFAATRPNGADGWRQPFFEDLYIGYSVSTGSHLVTESEIIDFAGKWDPQPFHLDEVASKGTFFGRLIGSGVHTYAITMRLCVDAGVFTGNAVMGLGFDRLRFNAPVYPGNRLAATVTVVSLRPSSSRPGLGIVTWDVKTADEDERLVLSVSIANLYRRRP
jgi:acyl dehydratase